MKTVCILFAKDHLSALTGKALLESNDIVCLFPDEHFSSVYPNYSVLSGGYRLYVSIYDEEIAKEVLEPHRYSLEAESKAEPEQNWERCPKCKTRDAEVLVKSSFLLKILLALFSVFPSISRKYTKKCKFCGNKWF